MTHCNVLKLISLLVFVAWQCSQCSAAAPPYVAAGSSTAKVQLVPRKLLHALSTLEQSNADADATGLQLSTAKAGPGASGAQGTAGTPLVPAPPATATAADTQKPTSSSVKPQSTNSGPVASPAPAAAAATSAKPAQTNSAVAPSPAPAPASPAKAPAQQVGTEGATKTDTAPSPAPAGSTSSNIKATASSPAPTAAAGKDSPAPTNPPAGRSTPPPPSRAAPGPTADANLASSINRLPFKPPEGSGAYDGCVWDEPGGGKVPKPHGTTMGNFQCCNGAWIKGGCGGGSPTPQSPQTRTD